MKNYEKNPKFKKLNHNQICIRSFTHPLKMDQSCNRPSSEIHVVQGESMVLEKADANVPAGWPERGTPVVLVEGKKTK